MELRDVGILVNYRCNIACRHCYINCGPHRGGMATNCSGVIIGDARETTLAQLHSDPDWSQNDILRTLADHGPVGLLDMAPEFEPRETYAQKCELCWEVRSHLAPSYPETLAPPECYTDQDEGPKLCMEIT